MKLFYNITLLFSLLIGESCIPFATANTLNNSPGGVVIKPFHSRMKSINPLVHRMHRLQHDAMDDLLQRTESESFDSDDVESKFQYDIYIHMTYDCACAKEDYINIDC